MNPKITNPNGFRAIAFLNKVAEDPRVAEIEGGAADDGRVFVHFVPGWIHPGYGTHSISAGSVDELKFKISAMIPESSE